MIDILTCKEGDYDGDLELTEDGDIQIEDNIAQNVRIALSWISGEWRLGPDIGLPYFDEILVKNPNLDLLKQDIANAILEVEGVTDAEVKDLTFDRKSRKITISFTCTVGNDEDEETYSEEVAVSG